MAKTKTKTKTPKRKGPTPLMRQYDDIKGRHPNEILFFRMGDFYEMFGQDAVVAAPALGITLTSRHNGAANEVPLAGFPHHAVDGYVKKLVDRGMRVAICEQVEDPKKAKGIVRREVVEVITPGTLVHDQLLDGSRNNYLVSLVLPARSGQQVGLARVDLSTGDFRTGSVEWDDLADELGRTPAGEIICDRNRSELLERLLPPELIAIPITKRESWEFEEARARTVLHDHFDVTTLGGFGLEDMPTAIVAAGAALSYLAETRCGSIGHLTSLSLDHTGDSMLLDGQTRRNLELTSRGDERRTEGTLLSVIDRTVTGPGARLLRRWLTNPLVEVDAIRSRQDAVEMLVDGAQAEEDIEARLRRTADLERICARLGVRRVSPRDLGAIRATLSEWPDLREAVTDLGSPFFDGSLADVPDLAPLADLLRSALAVDPPARASDPGVIADGHSSDLDEVRSVSRDGKGWIASYEAQAREDTGITSLKVRFNKVFGYFIEVTRPNLHLVPEDYQRKQTTANGERFITEELKVFETRVLNADEEAARLEAALFEALVDDCGAWIGSLQALAVAIAELDAIRSLARVAREQGYVRPVVDDSVETDVREGRHPVLDAVEMDEVFVPNDVCFDGDMRFHLVTGPNMAGKSTYLRQTGLIVLLAQVGSFVPAASARVGVVDRIFTRVGTSDDLLQGRSTFLVEMVETAGILHNATGRSLVLLDEIGRGTSTYDGLALAWAITEFIHGLPAGCPRTLFATHYHELTELVAGLPYGCNLTTQVREQGEKVIFLRRIVEGVADRSYGIHVARMAGIPRPVLRRAKQILARLESESGARKVAESGDQMDLFQPPAPAPPHPLVEELAGLDPDELSPKEAHDLLYDWKETFGRESDLHEG